MVMLGKIKTETDDSDKSESDHLISRPSASACSDSPDLHSSDIQATSTCTITNNETASLTTVKLEPLNSQSNQKLPKLVSSEKHRMTPSKTTKVLRRKRELKPNELSCKICRVSFRNVDELKSHVSLCLGTIHTCDRCGKHFKHKKNLMQHVMVHAGEFNYRCDVCNKTFIQKHAFEGHVNKHNQINPYICKKCGSTFSYKTSFTRHVHTCNAGARYHCKKCKAVFLRKESLDNHIAAQHEQVKYRCHVCEKEFPYRSSLSKHRKSQGHDIDFSQWWN